MSKAWEKQLQEYDEAGAWFQSLLSAYREGHPSIPGATST